MKSDPIVEEIRASRRRLLRKAGGTLQGLARELRAWEAEHPERLAKVRRRRWTRAGEGAVKR
ncbi:MAG: hypothetical protein HY721_28705 [Planctomycetes bacterium]|nr:hypothetical protein [Planctomycetota bacterium]